MVAALTSVGILFFVVQPKKLSPEERALEDKFNEFKLAVAEEVRLSNASKEAQTKASGAAKRDQDGVEERDDALDIAAKKALSDADEALRKVNALKIEWERLKNSVEAAKQPKLASAAV